MGIYVYEPGVLRHITPGAYLDFPDLVLRLLEAGERIKAFPSDCLWLDIGRPGGLRASPTALRQPERVLRP